MKRNCTLGSNPDAPCIKMRTAIKAIDLKSMEANLHLDNKRHMQQKMRTHDRVAPAGGIPLQSIDLEKFEGGLTYKSD